MKLQTPDMLPSSQAKSSATAAMQGVSGGPFRAMLLSFATIENSSVMLCVFLIFTLTQFKSMQHNADDICVLCDVILQKSSDK